MIKNFITTNLIKGLIMKRIEIMAIGRVVELESFEYEIDPLGHGGVRIIVEKLKNKKLIFELENIMKKFKYDMIVGRLVKE